MRMRRVVLWSTDPVGAVMAGPGIRYHRLAEELGQRFDVTLVAPGRGVPDAPYTFRNVESGADLDADVVVAQSLPLADLRRLRRSGARIVFDLYAPALVEAAAHMAEEGKNGIAPGVRYEDVLAMTRLQLAVGDAFLCASDRQRDHWLGALSVLGRVSPETYARDPSLGSLVAVVPFGLDRAKPVGGAVKGAFPGIGSTDRLLLWGGGIWNWFDPLTVIRAVGRLAEHRDDVKLLFLGLSHPSSAVGAMRMADEAIGVAQELGLEGSSVFFNRGWVSYDERLTWFADADLGVSAHEDTLEARLAFRTRLLDHISVGSPLVVTQGDVLAELVGARGLGRTVAAGDVEGWTTALAGLLDDERAYAKARRAVQQAQAELSWGTIGAALADLVERVASSPRRSREARAAFFRAASTLARSSVERRGLRATLDAAASAVRSSRRR